jgi:pyruvate dehydrogenase (quinone)
VDLVTLFKDVSEFVNVCMTPGQARHLVDRAVKVALTISGIATIVLPEGVQEGAAVESPPHMHSSVFSSVGWARPRIISPGTELRRAAEILNQGQRVAILAGQGAGGAAGEVVEAADLLGAGVAKALLGRDLLPDDLPFVTGRSVCSAPSPAMTWS